MLNTDKLKQLKELLDMGAITQEEFEEQKQAILQTDKPKKKGNIGLIITIIAVAIVCIAIMSGGNSNSQNTDKKTNTTSSEETTVPVEFSEKCPVEVSSSMYDNIIGVPEVKCTFKNTADKEIAAIKLHFEPRDVYDEEINTLFTANELYTDDPIAVGGTSSRSWQLLDDEIKSGDLYIYSVYFSDGTEWGNKDAALSDIKEYAYKISTKY